MLVYSRRSAITGARTSWVIGIRMVAVGVTLMMAWRWLDTVAPLRSAVTVYALLSACALLFAFTERRWRLHLITSLLIAAQIAAELVVISGIVHLSGGVSSPSVSLYLITIMAAALSYRLAGTLIAASCAAFAFVTTIWVGAGYPLETLWSLGGLDALAHLPDGEFTHAFLRVCIFYLCAFIGGYLAERLYSQNAELVYTSEALRRAKWETGDILKHLRSGVLTVDISGHIVYFNRAAEEILGTPEKRVCGRPIHDVFGKPLPELAERLESVLRSRRMDIRTELTIERPDGHRIPVGLSTSVLGGPGGKPRGVIAVFQDLTEAKNFEDRLRRQDRLAAIGELSAGIAHEIRNPLAAISGAVEVLQGELSLTGENRQLMELIIRESNRLNKILGDFLMYARMRPTSAGQVCVSTVLDEVLQIVRGRLNIEGSLVTLKSNREASRLFVMADGDHLKQILINLLFNAVESCQNDTTPGEITVHVDTQSSDELPDPVEPSERNQQSGDMDPDEWVSITVRDNGEGVPNDIADRLYEPFVSSKTTGTGLGLAIVKRLLDNIGGQIAVESKTGEGAAFTVYLPRCQSPTEIQTPRSFQKSAPVSLQAVRS